MRVSLLFLVVLTGCQALENRLIFHPMPGDAQTALALPAPLQDVELRTPDGEKIHARWVPRRGGRGALLYCHGNAGNLEHRGKLMREFWESLDRSVLIFDYPGFGRSEGKPSEAGCYASADAAYDWLTQVQGIPPDRIVLCGESLGGAVAVDLASKRPHQALILIRTFTTVPDVASRNFLLASASVFMVNRFDSLKKISTCAAPILLAQADKDRLIPYDHAEKLRDACKAPVRLHRLRGLDHNDPLPDEFFSAVRGFLDEVELPR